MTGGENRPTAGASKAVVAAARARQGSRIPARLEIARLTDYLADDFDEHRDNKAGSVPVPPQGPETMHEENTRHRGVPKKRWRGE
jgi:hypothetical protein